MLTRAAILDAFRALDAELRARSVRGEVCLYGGAVMCLVYDARPSTRDVDAVFAPSAEIRDAARSVAAEQKLPEDWLNDAVKGFIVKHPHQVILELRNLRVLVPPADYILAMKALSARVDSTDRDDVKFLIARLGITTAGEVFETLAHYYPNERIKPATRFFIEEILSP